MSEDNTKSYNGDSASPLSFEEFVRQQLSGLTGDVSAMRQEMVDRFLQLSRQIRHQKVDVFIQEQIYLKDEWRSWHESPEVKK